MRRLQYVQPALRQFERGRLIRQRIQLPLQPLVCSNAHLHDLNALLTMLRRLMIFRSNATVLDANAAVSVSRVVSF